MRLVFAGTPEPAIPSLRALVESTHDVVAVVTRPDAPAGRGRRLSASPIAEVAEEYGIPILKPVSAKDEGFQAELAELNPDACPVVAYGALIPDEALAIPTHGWINLHFSLLPAWRGAAPVQHSIIGGDEITGATTFRIESGLDTGPVFGVVTQSIGTEDTAGVLLDTLAVSGAELLVRTMDGIESGELVPVVQPSDGVSLAPKILVSDAQIVWSQPALAIDRRIRGCTPLPGAWSTFAGKRVKISSVAQTTAEVIDSLQVPSLDPGQLHATKRNVFVGTASVPIELISVKPEGKKDMPAIDWARGLQLTDTSAFEWSE